ncbi:MAG: ATP-binding protein [Planctomycetota bacterium]
MSLVLIADDEEALLDVLAEAVTRMGHQVVRALDGEEALSLVRSQPPDVILTDLMMPRCSGRDLIANVRADPALASTPIVLMSALRTGAHGADRILTKPITIATLEATLAEVLNGRSTARPAPAEPRRTPSPGSSKDAEQLLRWVAHELKTPLSAAQMATQLLLKESQGSDHAVARAQLILRQLERMSELVNDMLDAGQLAEGQVELDKKVGDLSDFLAAVVQDWRRMKPEHPIKLRVPGPVSAPFDPKRLRIVIDNLLSNAFKYGDPARGIEVDLDLSPAIASIRVTDHGPGIPASEQTRIFEQFRQQKSAKSPTGHGLGLFIAEQLTKLHRGSLRVRSELGKGTTFCVSLPLVK